MLDIADMDYKLNEKILYPMIERVKKGEFRYEYEDNDYFNAIIDWNYRRENIIVEKEWILPIHSVLTGIKLIINTFSQVGDTVLVQEPLYPGYRTVINATRRKVISNSLILDTDKYLINFYDLEKKIIKYKPSIFLFCNPHNPTGKVYCECEIKKIVEICKKYGVILVADEVHSEFVFGDIKFNSLKKEFESYNNIIVITSPNKTFNLASVQIANIIIFNKFNREKLTKEKQRYLPTNLNSFAINVCKSVYACGNEWLYDIKKKIVENKRIFEKNFLHFFPEAKIINRDSLYLEWIDTNKCKKDVFLFFQDEINVKILRGDLFGKAGIGFVRINLACDRKILFELLYRIQEKEKIK
jgi:Bifunctional PLP-dependent enzyme with beta-cystathionase and maltose regulon repressor activities